MQWVYGFFLGKIYGEWDPVLQPGSRTSPGEGATPPPQGEHPSPWGGGGLNRPHARPRGRRPAPRWPGGRSPPHPHGPHVASLPPHHGGFQTPSPWPARSQTQAPKPGPEFARMNPPARKPHTTHGRTSKGPITTKTWNKFHKIHFPRGIRKTTRAPWRDVSALPRGSQGPRSQSRPLDVALPLPTPSTGRAVNHCPTSVYG